MNDRAAKLITISRRSALGAIGLGAAGFVFFGPRGLSAEARGRIVVDYWEKWTGHEGEVMRRVVDEFNASQSRIFVRYLVTSNIGQKALIAIAGGTPPDILGLWNFNIPAYAESGAILGLDELARDAGLALDQYRAGIQRVMTHSAPHLRDKWFGVVNTAGTLALYCNNKLFADSGLAGKLPRTIDEMDAAHKALSRVRDGAVERMGFWHGEPGWWSWLWGYSFGASIFDEATGRATIDAPQNLAAYRWLQSYVRSPGLSSDQANAAAIKKFEDSYGFYNTAQNAFLSGKVAMVLQGPWLANMIKQFVPDMDYSVVPMPVAASVRDDASPIALVDTDVLCIPRGCKHPREAMEFIAFTQRPEITERLATAHCKVCPLKSCSSSFVASHPNRGLSVHNALADSPRAFVVPKTRAWPQIKDEFDAMVLRLRALKGDADTELATMQSRAQEMIDRVNQQRKLRYGEGAGRSALRSTSIANAIMRPARESGGTL